MELIQYIDFSSICDDFNLETGDITPFQQVELENIIKQFIKQNKQFTDKIRYKLDNINVTNKLTKFKSTLLVLCYTQRDVVL